MIDLHYWTTAQWSQDHNFPRGETSRLYGALNNHLAEACRLIRSRVDLTKRTRSHSPGKTAYRCSAMAIRSFPIRGRSQSISKMPSQIVHHCFVATGAWLSTAAICILALGVGLAAASSNQRNKKGEGQ
jgi:hypothetical protein